MNKIISEVKRHDLFKQYINIKAKEYLEKNNLKKDESSNAKQVR